VARGFALHTNANSRKAEKQKLIFLAAELLLSKEAGFVVIQKN